MTTTPHFRLAAAALLTAAVATLGACGGGGGGEDEECRPGSDGVVLAGAQISGRTLELGLEYGGGCGEHDFAIWWGGAIATSDPGIVPLELQHYANGDACEAAILESVFVDLSALDEEANPDLWIQIVAGDGGGRTLGSVLYSQPAEPTQRSPGALSINTACGTIEN